MAHEKVTQENKYFVQIVKGSFHQGCATLLTEDIFMICYLSKLNIFVTN